MARSDLEYGMNHGWYFGVLVDAQNKIIPVYDYTIDDGVELLS